MAPADIGYLKITPPVCVCAPACILGHARRTAYAGWCLKRTSLQRLPFSEWESIQALRDGHSNIASIGMPIAYADTAGNVRAEAGRTVWPSFKNRLARRQ